LFSYFQFLPWDEITTEHLNQLYALYRGAERRELPYSFDFLLKYRSLDKYVVARVTAIIVEKVGKDANFATALSGLLNPYTEVNKAITVLFADHLDLLKRAYFAALEARENEDHEGLTLARILDVDSGFILEYIDYMYERKEWSSLHEDKHEYSYLWMRDDYEKLMAQVAERIFEQEQERSILSGTCLQTFFLNDSEDTSGVREQQDKLLGTLIEHRHNDAEFMEYIFGVITQFSPERRRHFVSYFVKHNKRFEDFERLPLEPTFTSWWGSAVPMYQARVEYLESLVAVLNTVDLLQHRQYVERKIRWLRSQIEYEKRKDFLRD
jgi:hypothetical protein